MHILRFYILDYHTNFHDLSQEKIVRFQHGLLLENISNKVSNIGVTLEYLVICRGEKYFLEYHWSIIHLTIQDGIWMVVYWNIMIRR